MNMIKSILALATILLLSCESKIENTAQEMGKLYCEMNKLKEEDMPNLAKANEILEEMKILSLEVDKFSEAEKQEYGIYLINYKCDE